MTHKFALKASVAAIALALSASASAFNTVQIDYTGTGSVPGSKIADKLDNDPGNVLFQGIEPGALFPGSVPVNILGQGTAAFKAGSTSLNPAGIELTYVFGVPSFGSFVLGFGGENAFHIETAGGGYFEVYIQASGTANALAGTGFNTGTLILAGTFIPQTFPTDINTYTIPILCPLLNCDNLPLLDQFAGDSYAGLRTQPVQGSMNYFIDITYQNPLYILNNVSTFDPFDRDMNFNSSTLTPFNSTDPSLLLQNVANTGTTAPNYGNDTTPTGKLVNDTNCGTATPCDLHLQGDANSTFNTGPTIPEPASMALLGLGLGALGFIGRRRKLGKVA